MCKKPYFTDMFLFQRSVTTFDYYLNILSTFFRIISLKKTVACLFTFFVFCGSYHVEAQMDKQEADSLKIELVKPKNSKAKNNIIYQILTNSYQPDSILHYSNMGIANAKNDNNEWYSKFISIKAITFFKKEKDSFFHYHFKALSKAKKKETKAFIYQKIAMIYCFGRNVDSTRYYLNKLKSFNPQEPKIAADKFFLEAWLYEKDKNFGKALEYYNKAINLTIESGATKSTYLFYQELCFLYYKYGNTDLSIEALKKALLYTKIDTYEYGRILVILGVLSNELDRKDNTGNTYIERGINAYIKSDTENILIATGYKNLSLGYLKFNMNEEALKAIRKTKEYGDKSNSAKKLKTTYYYLLGHYYNNIDQLDSAENYIHKTLKLNEDASTSGFLNRATFQLGLVSAKRNQFKKAKDIFIKLLDNSGSRLESLEQLYKINKAENNTKKALKWHEEIYKIKDSIAQKQTKHALQGFLIKFNTKEKENELLKVELENKEKDIQLANQIRHSLITITTICFFVVLLIIFFFTHKGKKELKLKLELENEKAVIVEKNTILENLSHEIRTPITIINGYLNLIIKHKLKPIEVEKFANLATKNSDSILSKFNDFLSLIKTDKNDLQEEKEKQVLVTFFDQIMQSFSVYASLKNISISYRYNFKESISINFDFDKLQKIINNLITNAINYSDTHKKIFVDVLLHEEKFTIIVKDEGIGIPEEEHELVFQRFYQSKKHKISGGFGIGLSYVKELVDVLKGTINLESEEEKGTVFTVQFPLKLENRNIDLNSIQPTYKVVNSLTEDAGIESNLPKVLVVEDNLEMVLYLKEILLKHYNCVFVNNGKEALARVKEINFELIISDYKMPVMDGLRLKTALNSLDEYKDIPFLLMTAYSFENFENIQLHLGIEDYVAKPFTYQELVTRTRKLLQNTMYIKNIKKMDNTLRLDGHVAELIEKTKMCIIKNLSNSEYTISDLAGDCNYSQKQLGRILKSYTGLTLVQLMLEVKLQKAYELILNNKYPTLIEVVYGVGLNNRSYFNKKFKARFGIKPSDLQNK
jgi:signal transduction histidine kinase/CheY-like chemotaxis protein/AraC-like DNA-binding protein